MPRITIAEIEELCGKSLPWVAMLGFTIEEIGKGTCRVRLPQRAEFLRPGGTVSGPALISLADYGMYVAVLSAIGRVELAVTTNLTCNFRAGPSRGRWWPTAACSSLASAWRTARSRSIPRATKRRDRSPM